VPLESTKKHFYGTTHQVFTKTDDYSSKKEKKRINISLED